MTTAIGIDPASGKETCIWQGDDYQFVKPQNVRAEIEKILNNYDHCLIAWDAPLSFSENSYSDRAIDKATRAWVKKKVAEGVFEAKSINALPFSGLSHWVISCKALGLPFGEPHQNLSLYPEQYFSDSQPSGIIEVHPAVSMGCMWSDKRISEPFPVYKKSKDARKDIVVALGFPDACIESDDILDAYVAYLMADQFLQNKAMLVTLPSDGSYALPIGAAYEEISSMVS